MFARRESALCGLIADLDAAAEAGSDAAAGFAAEVRSGGQDAARHLLVTKVTPLVAVSPAGYAHDPVVRAFCGWHQARTGVDLLAGPEDHQRARAAQDAARRAVDDARQRRATTAQRRTMRRHELNLEVIQATARRQDDRSTTAPPDA